MAESGFTSFKRYGRPGWNNVAIPANGIYIVGVTADSSYGSRPPAHIRVSLWDPPHFLLDYFIIYASDIVGHAEVAVPLKQNDTLTLFVHGKVHAVTSFSVAYVSGLDGHYTTVAMTSPSNSALLHFDMELGAIHWRGLTGNQMSSFSVPTTGMYWVTARVVPISIDVVIRVETENSTSNRMLFDVWGEKGRSVSCSGAFRLSAGTVVKVKTTIRATYTSGTMMSFVYLEGNRKLYTGPDEHIAFTGTVKKNLWNNNHRLIPFLHHLTNYGRLHVPDGAISIRKSGSYMISLRSDPPANATTKIDVLVNGLFKWRFISRMGVPSGQTISLVLKAKDQIKVINHMTHYFENGTLFSIAFLRR